MDVLISVATPFESSLLREAIGRRDGIRIIETGVGPVNAAHGVTLAITERRADIIVSCGVGGAYPTSGLKIGDVVCASHEIYGDLGAQSPTGFLDMQALGFPVVSAEQPLFNELPLQVFPLPRRERFVTLSTCTGTNAAAGEIQQRTDGAVENMEGAAVVHVANIHRIPVAEIRGISNHVGDRDKSTWRLKEASEAAQRALIGWVETGCPISSPI